MTAALSAAAQQPVSTPGERQIVVWRVGSPYTGDIPDTTVPLDLKVNAAKIGCSIRIEAFRAKAFAQTFFDAFERHQEPDVIAFDNYGIIDGITTQLGGFTGIGSSPTVRNNLVAVSESLKNFVAGDRLGGWQFLVSTSKNREAARLLALRPPECSGGLPLTPMPSDIQLIAQRVSDTYLQRSTSLQTYEDGNRLIAEGVGRDPLQVSETKACGCWGNEHLAFVSMVSTFDSTKMVGQIHVLLILRKQGAQWQLLAASTDPISNGPFLSQIPAISGVLQKPWNSSNEPIPAELLFPENGGLPKPASGERFGNFNWRPSPSVDVVAEIVEFAYQNDARLFLRLRSRKLTTDEISEGLLLHSQSQWKWRVWSITDAGTVAFSQPRSFWH